MIVGKKCRVNSQFLFLISKLHVLVKENQIVNLVIIEGVTKQNKWKKENKGKYIEWGLNHLIGFT